jgi:putative transposase
MDIKRPAEETVWRGGKIFGKHIPGVGKGMGEPNRGRASVSGGPCVYADRNTTEIFCRPIGGIYQGKSAIARKFVGKRKNFCGMNFRARGYYVSTVGRDEATIRKYIREQKVEGQR